MCNYLVCGYSTAGWTVVARTQTAVSALSRRESPSGRWTFIGSTFLAAFMALDHQPTMT